MKTHPSNWAQYLQHNKIEKNGGKPSFDDLSSYLLKSPVSHGKLRQESQEPYHPLSLTLHCNIIGFFPVGKKFIPRRAIRAADGAGSTSYPIILQHRVYSLRGLPYMKSALRGRGVSPKEDVVREVA